jgi:tRNA 2-thiouridine synthesizing protein D
MANINFLLTEGPFQTEKWGTVSKLAAAALDKGHEVTLFCYLDGIYNGLSTQEFADWEKVPGEYFKEIVDKGAEIVCCGICVNARGQQAGKFFYEGIKVGGIPDWAAFVGRADRVITL